MTEDNQVIQGLWDFGTGWDIDTIGVCLTMGYTWDTPQIHCWIIIPWGTMAHTGCRFFEIWPKTRHGARWPTGCGKAMKSCRGVIRPKKGIGSSDSWHCSLWSLWILDEINVCIGCCSAWGECSDVVSARATLPQAAGLTHSISS